MTSLGEEDWSLASNDTISYSNVILKVKHGFTTPEKYSITYVDI